MTDIFDDAGEWHVPNPKDCMCAGEALVTKHLKECCAELVEWDNTAILCDGRIREVARIYRNVSSHSALAMARSEVERQAVLYVSGAK